MTSIRSNHVGTNPASGDLRDSAEERALVRKNVKDDAVKASSGYAEKEQLDKAKKSVEDGVN